MQLICRAYSAAEDILRVGRWEMILIQPLNAKYLASFKIT
jgi:hypothetical protein